MAGAAGQAVAPRPGEQLFQGWKSEGVGVVVAPSRERRDKAWAQQYERSMRANGAQLPHGRSLKRRRGDESDSG